MVAFTIGKPITTDVGGIEVDGLPAGSHRFQLVVEDRNGVRSQPQQIVVLVRDRVLPPIDPPIVRPPVVGPVIDPVRPPITGPVIAGPLVSPLVVRDAGPAPPPPKPTPARKSKRRKP